MIKKKKKIDNNPRRAQPTEQITDLGYFEVFPPSLLWPLPPFSPLDANLETLWVRFPFICSVCFAYIFFSAKDVALLF